MLDALVDADISVDERAYGIRVSPHIYNDQQDIARFVDVIKKVL